MVDYNRIHSPNHPIWEYPALDKEGEVEQITWKGYGEAMYAATRLIESVLEPDATGEANKREVIALISGFNQPTFMALELGIFLTGHVPFLLSPRNFLSAIIHLLKLTKTTHLMVDADNPSFMKLATGTASAVELETGTRIPTLPTPQFGDLYGVIFHPFEPKIQLQSLREVAAILHSSGSTAFPKPIETSHAMLLEFSRLFWWSDTDMCGKRENGMVLPSFHNYALVQVLCKSVPSGKINCTYNPHVPTQRPTAAQALKDIVASNSFMLLMVPAFLSEWSRDPAAIAELSKFQAIFTGGAPMSKEAGTTLLEGGVKLVNLYGSTECGISSRLLITNTLGSDWECIEKVGNMKWHLTDEKDGTFELHVMQHRFANPGVINLALPDGSRGFSTSDLLAPHPTNPKLWRTVGRKDEQILLSNGEKTNPSPSEGIINKDDLVLDSMMFGEGKSQNGSVNGRHLNLWDYLNGRSLQQDPSRTKGAARSGSHRYRSSVSFPKFHLGLGRESERFRTATFPHLQRDDSRRFCRKTFRLHAEDVSEAKGCSQSLRNGDREHLCGQRSKHASNQATR